MDEGNATTERMQEVQGLKRGQPSSGLFGQKRAENFALRVFGNQECDSLAVNLNPLLGDVLDNDRAVPELV